MKVLLSAFACEPNVGSEYAVGWNWAVSLAEAGHDVTVITRSEARSAIERAVSELPSTIKLHFVYFDVPRAIRWQMRGPLHFHCIVWQWQVARFVRRALKPEGFDRVHHVTYAGLRAPSFMGSLGIPFVFGPVGGGESAPWRLRMGYSALGLFFEALRDLANLAVRTVPILANTIAQAEKIYVTSQETLQLLPIRYRHKVTIELAIGTQVGIHDAIDNPPRQARESELSLLYVGRFVDYKGMHLGLPAFAALLRVLPQARLTMVGDGPQKTRWQKLAAHLGIASNVDWLPWQTHRDMPAIYRKHDVLLFPCLHDSGGFVVLEAMKEGLPVVCLKLGGPGTMVNDSCGRAVDVAGKSRKDVIRDLARALTELNNEKTRSTLAAAARLRSQDFSWQEKVIRLYGAAA